jgi:hypothetical protein
VYEGNPPGFETIIVSVYHIMTAPESILDGSTTLFMTDPGVCSSPSFQGSLRHDYNA